SACGAIRKVDFGTGKISTVAGTLNSPGDSGDGGAPTDAQLAFPIAVAWDNVDSAMFIADQNNHKVRKVEGGIITTFAGSGATGDTGDGGDATDATFQEISSLAFNPMNGSLYIADRFSSRVREVRVDGKIYNFSGDGANPGLAGDGGPYGDPSVRMSGPRGLFFDAWGTSDASLGALYIAGHNQLRQIALDTGLIRSLGEGLNNPATYGGDQGPATQAQFSDPVGVALWNGEVWVMDKGDGFVRHFPDGGNINTANGGFGNGVAIASNDNGVFVADGNANKVYQVMPFAAEYAGTGVAGDTGDGGAATSAEINGPISLIGHGTDLYIGESDGFSVRKVDNNGDISTVAGDGTDTDTGDGGAATSAGIGIPTALAVDGGGNLFIGAVVSGMEIRRVDAGNGQISTVMVSATGGHYGDMGGPIGNGVMPISGMAFDGADNLYLGDDIYFTGYAGGSVRKILGPL
ncbi:MAG TPA: hypothetical protein VFR41_01735, partial [Acidimicrobiia bacterium]|nr:hypothetical protein [Acidimicrobiia bacterium]